MSAAEKISYSSQLTIISGGCYRCGIPFAMPTSYYRQLNDSGEWFWCPNGHRQRYMETTAQRMQKQIDAQARRAERAERAESQTRESLKTECRRSAAFKGNVTKLKGRIGNGVCPCCNRSFENVARHMRSKHPEFDPNHADVEETSA